MSKIADHNSLILLKMSVFGMLIMVLTLCGLLVMNSSLNTGLEEVKTSSNIPTEEERAGSHVGSGIWSGTIR